MRKRKQINIQIGERLKYQREKAGLTQERFAELLDISPNHISDIERGVSGISLETLRSACRILYISSEQLLADELENDGNDAEWLVKKLERLEPVYFDKLVGIINCYVEAIAVKEHGDGERSS